MKSLRGEVIRLSAKLEYSISRLLCVYLDIDFEKSKVFGQKSGNLSFSHKLNLLLEMKLLDNTEKEKISLFSSIRNQFAHVPDVENFNDCFKRIPGTKKKLVKIYLENLQKEGLIIESEDTFLTEEDKEQQDDFVGIRLYIRLLQDIIEISDQLILRVNNSI